VGFKESCLAKGLVTIRRIETRIFRIDTEVAEQLDELAQKDKISVNVIANQALRRHVEYDA